MNRHTYFEDGSFNKVFAYPSEYKDEQLEFIESLAESLEEAIEESQSISD